MADLVKGYPSIKEDVLDFDNDDLRALTREMHPLASKLAEDTDLSYYQSIYDADNKRVNAPTHDRADLTAMDHPAPIHRPPLHPAAGSQWLPSQSQLRLGRQLHHL